MDNFNVLILMQKDAEGLLTNTVDSYQIDGNNNLIIRFFVQEEEENSYIYMAVTTEDIEDWQFYALYDLYNAEIYTDLGIEVVDNDLDEYNPVWLLKFKYSEDRETVTSQINKIVDLHYNELARVLEVAEADKAKYQAEADSIEE